MNLIGYFRVVYSLLIMLRPLLNIRLILLGNVSLKTQKVTFNLSR